MQPIPSDIFPTSLLPRSYQNSQAPQETGCTDEPLAYKQAPELMPPLYLLSLLVRRSQMQLMQNTMQERSHTINDEEAKRQEFVAKKLQAIKKVAEKTKAKETWGILWKVASAVSSLISLTFGVGMIASGSPFIGALMFTSGSLTLAHMVTSELGGWEKLAEYLSPDDPQKKAKILAQIQIWIGAGLILLSLSSSLGGIASSFISGTGMAVNEILRNASNISQGCSQIAQGSAGIGHAVTEWDRGLADIGAKQWDAKATFQKQIVEEALEKHKKELDQYKKIMENLYQQSILQPKAVSEILQRMLITDR